MFWTFVLYREFICVNNLLLLLSLLEDGGMTRYRYLLLIDFKSVLVSSGSD